MGFDAQRPNEVEVIIGEPGSRGQGAEAFVETNVTAEKTVEQIADEVLAPIAQLTPSAGHELCRCVADVVR